MAARTITTLMVFATVAAIGLCSVTSATGPTTRASGVVTDLERGAIEDAHLLFHPDAAGIGSKTDKRLEVSCKTDRAGHFEAELEPGFYDMCVMALAFTPQCRKILVEGKPITDRVAGKPLKFDFKLKADPLVWEHLGFRVGRRDG
jgi:hypothetical protein